MKILSQNSPSTVRELNRGTPETQRGSDFCDIKSCSPFKWQRTSRTKMSPSSSGLKNKGERRESGRKPAGTRARCSEHGKFIL
jgi:hypothetical protein